MSKKLITEIWFLIDIIINFLQLIQGDMHVGAADCL